MWVGSFIPGTRWLSAPRSRNATYVVETATAYALRSNSDRTVSGKNSVRISSEGSLFRCSACGVDRPPAAFSFSDERRRLLNSYCRECQAAYRRAHYLANKSDYVRRAVAQVKGRREQNRQEVLLYLAAHPCVDCGASDLLVLEFDHRDPTTKLTEIGRLMVNRRWPRVLAEIEKCDVRCVNCHRRKTARDYAWKKFSPRIEL